MLEPSLRPFPLTLLLHSPSRLPALTPIALYRLESPPPLDYPEKTATGYAAPSARLQNQSQCMPMYRVDTLQPETDTYPPVPPKPPQVLYRHSDSPAPC